MIGLAADDVVEAFIPIDWIFSATITGRRPLRLRLSLFRSDREQLFQRDLEVDLALEVIIDSLHIPRR